MGRSNETFSKKEKEKKKERKKKEKQKRKEERQSSSDGGGLDSMMAYVDENGVIVDTPPDPDKKKTKIKAENIEIGIPKKEEMEEEDPIHEGKVTFFNDEKGYGFIKDKNNQESYFVHINNLREPVAEGDKVEFETERGPKGMVAIKVKKL
ncbi:MAG: cold shock domain-containing protein [Crocinitomicaceae bacterium]